MDASASRSFVFKCSVFSVFLSSEIRFPSLELSVIFWIKFILASSNRSNFMASSYRPVITIGDSVGLIAAIRTCLWRT